jgi:hypothetical protein
MSCRYKASNDETKKFMGDNFRRNNHRLKTDAWTRESSQS